MHCQFLNFGPPGTTCEGDAPWVKSPNYFDPVTFISLPCIKYFKAHYIALIYNIGTDLQEDYSARTKHWHSVQSTCTIAVPGLQYGVRTESTDCEFSIENMKYQQCCLTVAHGERRLNSRGVKSTILSLFSYICTKLFRNKIDISRINLIMKIETLTYITATKAPHWTVIMVFADILQAIPMFTD